MAEIRLPRHCRPEVVKYLHETVDTNSKRSDQDDELAAYRVSTTAQIAVWKSENGLWEVEQRSRWHHIVVQSSDERLLLMLALKWA